jgi:ankyrin repeat protein
MNNQKKPDKKKKFPPGENQWTELHIAAHYGNLNKYSEEELIEYLPKLRDNRNRTPLHWAAKYRNLHQTPPPALNTENLLLQDDDGETPLYWGEITGELNNKLPLKTLYQLKLHPKTPKKSLGWILKEIKNKEKKLK